MRESRPRTANQAARLSGPAAFESIFRQGSRAEGRYVQIVSMPAQAASGRVGFVVSRKVLARAVDRNRLKRLLREFLRSIAADVARFDLVIRVKRPVPREALDDVSREAANLIGKAVCKPAAAAASR